MTNAAMAFVITATSLMHGGYQNQPPRQKISLEECASPTPATAVTTEMDMACATSQAIHLEYSTTDATDSAHTADLNQPQSEIETSTDKNIRKPVITFAATRERLASVKEIDYFPAADGWSNMWTNYEPAVIGADFTKMHDLGANTVRITIDPYALGWPTVTPTGAAELANVFSMAKNNKLNVQLSLFDGYNDYTDLTDSDTWINSALEPYKDDKQIAFVDVQNEVNPKNAVIMAWVKQVIISVRKTLGNVPDTVSVTNGTDYSGNAIDAAQNLVLLKAALGNVQLNLFDIHEYGEPGAAEQMMRHALDVSGKTPLFVGEQGASTYNNGICDPNLNPDQQYTERAYEWAIQQQKGLPPGAPWNLNDFSPGDFIGEGTNQMTFQNCFGLETTTGAEKASALMIKQLFVKHVISTNYNATFSSQTDGLPTYWHTNDTAQGSFEWDGTVGHDSLGSARISDTSSGTQDPAFSNVPIENLTAPGQIVTDSVWAAGTNTTGYNGIDVAWFNDQGQFISNTSSPSLASGSTSWTELSTSAVAPATAKYFQIDLKSTGDIKGSVAFDDVNYTIGAVASNHPS
jgi:hypothetical protein